MNRNLALVATFAALIAALGVTPPIYLPGNPVPITVQGFGIMIAGLILGARLGAAAVLVFLALVAIGLPILPGGRGGLGVFAGPTVGYLIGFPIGALVIGSLVRLRRRPAAWWTFLSTVIGGIGVVYLFGIPIQAARVGTKTLGQTIAASAVYVPGDLIKAALATLVATAVYRGYPQAVPGSREQQSTSHTIGV